MTMGLLILMLELKVVEVLVSQMHQENRLSSKVEQKMGI